MASTPQSDVNGEIEARSHLMKMVPRLGDPPHALLGVTAGAGPDELRQAFLRLTKLYHPARFARFSPEIVRASNEVFLTIKRAYDQLAPGPSSRGTHAGRGPVRARTVPAASAPAPRATPPPTTRAPHAAPPPTTRAPHAAPPSTATAGGARPPPRAATTPGPGVRPARPTEAPRAAPPASTAPPPAGDPAWEAAQELLRRKLWNDARQAFHLLAVAAPADKRPRAHMHYARAREAQDAGRNDEARAELQRALATDPDLAIARRALDDLTPPEPAKGGLFSKLFKR